MQRNLLVLYIVQEERVDIVKFHLLLSIVIRVDPEKPNADEVAVDANGEESGISDCSIDGTFSEQAGFVSVSSCVKLVLNLILLGGFG